MKKLLLAIILGGTALLGYTTFASYDVKNPQDTGVYFTTTTEHSLRDGYGGAIRVDQYGRTLISPSTSLVISSAGTSANPIANGYFTNLDTSVLTVSDTVLGTLYIIDGTTTTPGLAFDSDTGLGWSRQGSGALTLRVSSSFKWAFDDDSYTDWTIDSNGALTIPDTSPTTTFNNPLVASDLTSGILTLPQDGGVQTLVNMVVSSDATAGVEQGMSFDIDNMSTLSILREADGSGSLRTTTTIRAGSFTCWESVNKDGDTVYSSFGSGASGATLSHSTSTPCN